MPTPADKATSSRRSPGHFMTRLALWETDDVTWLEQVGDAEYTGERRSTRCR